MTTIVESSDLAENLGLVLKGATTMTKGNLVDYAKAGRCHNRR